MFISFSGHRVIKIVVCPLSLVNIKITSVSDPVQQEFALESLSGTHGIKDKESLIRKLREGYLGWKLAAISHTNTFGDRDLNWLASGVTEDMVNIDDDSDDDL